MKHMKLRSVILVIMLLASINVFSHDFENEGVYYNILSEKDKTHTITNIDNCCKGHDGCLYFRIVPETIIYNNNCYTVTRANPNLLFRDCSCRNFIILPNFIINLLLVLIILLIVLVIV